MINALDYNLAEWADIVREMGEPNFRAKQIHEGIYKTNDFDNISNLPRALKEKLSDKYVIGVEILKSIESKKDGTVKYLFKLSDGNVIEGVLMRYKYGNTLCISSQVGCRMNCSFCASGLHGLIRGLTAGEMAGQVTAVNKAVGGGERAVTNIVLMGSGEPLDNYDNVVKFIGNICEGLGVSKRNISLSTCGLADKIYDLAKDCPGVTLTVSLHASNDMLRSAVMPVNNKWKIADIMKAVKYYFDATGRRIIFEYSMISGKNDSLDYADELSALLRYLPCHVNLINLNYVKEKGLRASKNEQVQKFKERLEKNKISVTVRRTMGSDIEGACGQLRNQYMNENETSSI